MQKREDCKTTSTINFNQKLESTARPRRANAFTVLNYTVVSRSKVSYSTCRPQVCVEKLISSSCKSERKREQERERERERERKGKEGKGSGRGGLGTIFYEKPSGTLAPPTDPRKYIKERGAL